MTVLGLFIIGTKTATVLIVSDSGSFSRFNQFSDLHHGNHLHRVFSTWLQLQYSRGREALLPQHGGPTQGAPLPNWSYSLFYWRHLELRTNLDPQLHLWSCHNDGNMRKIIWSRQAVNSSSLGLNINMQVRRLVVNYQFQARESMCWWWGVWWAFLGLRHLLKTACHFKRTTTDLVLAILRSGQQYSLRDWLQMS